MKIVTALVLSALFASASAFAQEPTPPPTTTWSATLQLAYPVSLDTGDGLPISVVHGFGALVPISEHWRWGTEIGFATGVDGFRPRPQIAVGPAYRLEKWSVGIAGSYRWLPAYGDTTSDHMVGVTFVPAHPITPGITLAFPTGVTHVIGLDTWSFVTSFKLVFKL